MYKTGRFGGGSISWDRHGGLLVCSSDTYRYYISRYIRKSWNLQNQSVSLWDSL